MKKYIIIFLTLSISGMNSQNLTFGRTYSVSSMGQPEISSLVYGNAIFNAYSTFAIGGITFLQKNDLEGNPVLVKSCPKGFEGINLEKNNGYLYLTGTYNNSVVAYAPFIMKIDTANFSIIYFKTIGVITTGNTFIHGRKFLSNGNLILVGSTIAGSVSRGFISAVDPLTGNTVYTRTLAVGGVGSTDLNDVAQISNSGLLFTGFFNGDRFIAKAILTPSSLSVTSAYMSNCGLNKMEYIPNTPKVISYNSIEAFKIDTGLTTINSSFSKQFSPIQGYVSTYFIKNKIYRLGNYIDCDIIDSAIATATLNSYPFIASSFSSATQVEIGRCGTVFEKNNSLYISYSAMHGFNTFSLIKTNLNGQVACSNSAVSTLTAVPTITSASTSFTQGVLPVNITSGSLGTSVIAVSYVDDCYSTTVGLAESNSSKEVVKVSFNGTQYLFESKNEIAKIEVYDIAGKEIRTFEFNSVEMQASVDLSMFEAGIYLARIKLSNGSISQFKLMNY